MFFTVFMYMSTWCRVLELKLSCAETQLEEQETRLEEQEERLEEQEERLLKLVEMVNALEEKNRENERRVELQQHEIKEQEATLHELSIALQMKNGPLIPYALPGATEGSKPFWLFRQHQRNLAHLTKPCINQVIRASVEAGVVSELVMEECGETRSTPEQSSSVFYKALQMKISESPQSLAIFLRLLQENSEVSKPCRRLCSNILAELDTA